MMNYEELKEMTKQELTKRFEKDGIAVEVFFQTSKKVNLDVESICIQKEGSAIGVNLDTQKIFDILYKEVMSSVVNAPKIDMDPLTNYTCAKENLILDAMSAKDNEELLRNIPHFVMEDIAIAYRVRVDVNENKASTLVTNALLERWGISEETLKADAVANASRVEPMNIIPISSVVFSMMQDEDVEEGEPIPILEDEIMFVARNQSTIYGASVLAYPDFFEKAALLLNSSFYVLPSSRHEVILVREERNEYTDRKYKDTVGEVNTTSVKPDEKLTDSVYFYDAAEKTFVRV